MRIIIGVLDSTLTCIAMPRLLKQYIFWLNVHCIFCPPRFIVVSVSVHALTTRTKDRRTKRTAETINLYITQSNHFGLAVKSGSVAVILYQYLQGIDPTNNFSVSA